MIKIKIRVLFALGWASVNITEWVISKLKDELLWGSLEPFNTMIKKHFDRGMLEMFDKPEKGPYKHIRKRY